MRHFRKPFPKASGLTPLLFLGAESLLAQGAEKSWNEILSNHVRETYSVEKGDTFASISKKLFGKSKYWLKIWKLNQQTIKKPEQLAPGQILTFSGIHAGSDASEGPTEKSHSHKIHHHVGRHHHKGHHSHSASNGRSREWQDLPLQKWENFIEQIPSYVDASGFDKRNKVFASPQLGFEAQAFPSTERIKSIGLLFGSRSESRYLVMGDVVYIQANEPLTVGQVYAVSQAPWILESAHPPRKAFSYLTLGKVKIIGVRHHIFIGRMISARFFIPRGSFIIPFPPRIPELKPIAGPRSIKGSIVIDHNFSTYTSAQYKEVYIDRGSVDGIQPGMVFRAYKHQDPATKKTFSKYDFIVDADILVTQVTDNFCSGFVTHSTSSIQEGASVSLVTDLSTLKEREFEAKEDKQDLPDDLEKLDSDEDEDLGPDDARVVKQLENWKENPSTSSALPPPVPSNALTPVGEADDLNDLPPSLSLVPPSDDGDLAPSPSDVSLMPPPPAGGDDLAPPDVSAPQTNAALAPPPTPGEATGALAPPPSDDLAPLPGSEAASSIGTPPPPPAQGTSATPPPETSSAQASFQGTPSAPETLPPPAPDNAPAAAQNNLAPPPGGDELDLPPASDLPAPPSG